MSELNKTQTVLSNKDIISCLKSKGLSAEQSKIALQTLVDLITESISTGHTVKINKLGKFSKVYRAERKARNPQDREQIVNVPAHWVAKFYPSKAIKDSINLPLN